MMKVLLTLRSNWTADELESGRMEKFEVIVNSQIKLEPPVVGNFEISEKEKINLRRGQKVITSEFVDPFLERSYIHCMVERQFVLV